MEESSFKKCRLPAMPVKNRAASSYPNCSPTANKPKFIVDTYEPKDKVLLALKECVFLLAHFVDPKAHI